MKSLNLGRYFSSQPRIFANSSPSIWSSIVATDLSLPLTQQFDADLRISADKVTMGTVQVGRAAAALTVSQGRLLADIAAFEFDGARGSGQIIADMSGPAPKVSLRGRIEDLESSRATTSLFGHSVFTGRMAITTDIAATGKTGEQLLQSSSGRVSVAMRNGGRIGIDLRGLGDTVRKRIAEGWGSPARGQTSFDELDGTFQVRAGTLVIDRLRARSGDLATILSGMVDIPANRLNGSIVQLPITTADASGVTTSSAEAAGVVRAAFTGVADFRSLVEAHRAKRQW